MLKKIITLSSFLILFSNFSFADSLENILEKTFRNYKINKNEIITATLYPKLESEKEFRKLKILYKKGKTSKSKITITEPKSLSGLSLINIQSHKNSMQWIYLPAFKKFKRIIGKSSQQSFAGSVFSYNDFIPIQKNKGVYSIRTEEQKSVMILYKNKDVIKTIYISKPGYLIYKIQTQSQKINKTTYFKNYKISSKETKRPFLIEITDNNSKKSSKLVINSVEDSSEISESNFSTSN